MKLSNAIRNIRLLKGVSQKNVSSGFISQGNYSKFENNTADIPSTALFGILKNLDINIEEVIFIANGYNYSEEENIYRDFFKSSISNTDLLKDFVQRCENYLKVQNNETIIMIHQISLYLLKAIQNNDIYFNKEQALHLLDFFSNKDHLFIKDLYIINCIFFLFPIDVAHLTMGYINESIKKYKDFQSINRIEVNFRMNYSLMLIKENLDEMALQQLDIVLPQVKIFKMHIQLAILYIRKGICLKNLLQHDVGNGYIEKGLLILDTLEEQTLLINIKKEIEMYIK